jgi:hypothetical protein
MRSILFVAGTAGLIGIFTACGGDARPNAIGDGGTSNGGRGGKGGSKPSEGGDNPGGASEGGAGGSTEQPNGGEGGEVAGSGATGQGGAGGSDVDPGTPPVVDILSPTAVTDPLGGQVLVSDFVDVICKANAGDGVDASPLDTKSVKLAVLSAAGDLITEKDAALTVNADEYSATLPLAMAPTGKIEIRCTARSMSGAEASDKVHSLVDQGPAVTLTAPQVDANLALKAPVTIRFTALPQPLATSGDVQAEIASVALKINGVSVPTVAVQASPGTYEATVNLNGPLFSTKPNGATAIAVSATNKRAPDAVTATSTSNVFVDGTGPEITVTNPTATKIVGNIVPVTFKVTDASAGVDVDSISVSVDNQTFVHGVPPTWTRDGDTFIFNFDSRSVPNSPVQVNFKVSATDKVGNTTTSASIPTYLDNVPPRVDLDPANVRTQSSTNLCSTSFDPLGENALNDRQKDGTGLEFLRAFVWDDTNREPNSPALPHISGTKLNAVRLFFSNPSDTKPLLVNSKTAGTGTCDSISDSGDPSESLDLIALTPKGSPWYSGNSSTAPVAQSCAYPNQLKPDLLCGGDSDLWQVVGHYEGDLAEPAVFAYSPTNGSECTGQAWGFKSLIDSDDGWVCFAARATDNAGNIGISRPLRVCIDTDATDGQAPPCADAGSTPPSCTDGCTPPGRAGGNVISLN